MRAIEDEAARMGQLVEDLLLLARLDEERPLATRPIALDRVVELAVSAAKVVDPERPLDCQLEQPIVVAGDETRVRQVVNNLLANTRRETLIDTYAPYLRQRWDDGCTDATMLLDEIRGQGFRGSIQTVRRYLQPFRRRDIRPVLHTFASRQKLPIQ